MANKPKMIKNLEKKAERKQQVARTQAKPAL